MMAAEDRNRAVFLRWRRLKPTLLHDVRQTSSWVSDSCLIVC